MRATMTAAAMATIATVETASSTIPLSSSTIPLSSRRLLARPNTALRTRAVRRTGALSWQE
jgi:hypothetical protein